MGLVSRPKALRYISTPPNVMHLFGASSIDSTFFAGFVRPHQSAKDLRPGVGLSTDRNCGSGMICHRLIRNLERADQMEKAVQSLTTCIIVEWIVCFNPTVLFCIIIIIITNLFLVRSVEYSSGVAAKRR